MRYAANQEKGFSGVEPFELGEDVVVVQDIYPGTIDELKAEILRSTVAEELPESIGTYQGSDLTWELHVGETRIPELGSSTVSILLGLASDESGFK